MKPHTVTLDVFCHTDLTSPDGVDVRIATITVESAPVPNDLMADADTLTREVVESSIRSVVEGMADHALMDNPLLSLRVRRNITPS